MTDKALARIDTGALLMSGGLDDMMRGATMLVKSGLLPDQVKTPEQAIVIMLKGQELGIPPMEAMNRIHVIKGKPTLSASLMAALVERALGPDALIVEESTNDHCTVSVWKPGWDKRRTTTYSMKDAQQAGLGPRSDKDYNNMYLKYPRAMLRSRAISEACETYFQSIVGGIYTPEEVGGLPAEEDISDGEGGHGGTASANVTGNASEAILEMGGAHSTEDQPVSSSRGRNGNGKPLPVVAEAVDTDTGEILDGEYRDVEEEPSGPVPEDTQDGVEGEDSPEFYSYLRDLSRLKGEDIKPDDIMFASLDSDERMQLVKNQVMHAFNAEIKGTDPHDDASQQYLKDLRDTWGEHVSWTEQIEERWEKEYSQVVPV